MPSRSPRGISSILAVSLTVALLGSIGACTSGPPGPPAGDGAGGNGGGAPQGTGGAVNGAGGGGGAAMTGTGGGIGPGGGAGSGGTAGGGGRGGGTGGAGNGGTAGGGGGVAGGGGTAGGGGIAGGGPGGGPGGGGGGVPPTLVMDVSTAANPVAPGGRSLYTITVGNVSNHAVDAVTVSLLLPIGLQFNYIYDSEPNSSTCAGSATCSANGQATWTLGSLAAGASRTIVVNPQVLQTVGDGDSIATSFKLSATGMNDIIVTKTVQVYTQSAAQLSTGTATYPLVTGQRFTLDIDVGQVGGTALAGAQLQASVAPGLTIASASDGGTMAMPGVASWSIGAVAVGAALHRQIEVTVDANAPAGAVLVTKATLTYDGGLAVDAAADYAVVVAAMPSSLAVNVAPTVSPVAPSARVAYVVTVSNLASRAIDGVQVELRLPTGLQFNYIYDSEPNSSTCAGSATCVAHTEAYWTLGTIAAGASRTVVVNPQIVANMVGNGKLIRSPFFVTGTGVAEVAVVKTLQVLDSPAAQLALGTTANPVTNAQAFTYTLDVGQIGLTPLGGTELRLRLPAGLTIGDISDGGTQASPGEIVWPIGAVAVGADLRRTVAVTGDGTAAPGTILAARAMLTYDGGAAVDVLTEYALPVIAAPQSLTFTVTGSPSPVTPGNRLLYMATVTNTSARAIDGVVAMLRLPTGLQFNYINDSDPNSSTCAGSATCAANTEAFWTLGTMAAGASQIITLNATVLAGLLQGSLLVSPFQLNATGLTDAILLQTVTPTH